MESYYSDSEFWSDNELDDTGTYTLWKPPPLKLDQLKDRIEVVNNNNSSYTDEWIQPKKTRRNCSKKNEAGNSNECHTSGFPLLDNETKKRKKSKKKIKGADNVKNIETNNAKPDKTVAIEFYNDVNGTVTEICKINRVCKLNNGTFELHCDLTSDVTSNLTSSKSKKRNLNKVDTKQQGPDILIQIETDPKDVKKRSKKHKKKKCAREIAKVSDNPDEAPYFEIQRNQLSKKSVRNKKSNKKLLLQRRKKNKELIRNLTYYFNFVTKILLVYIFYRLVKMGYITSLMDMFVTNILQFVFVTSKLSLMFICFYLGIELLTFLFNIKPLGIFDLEIVCGFPNGYLAAHYSY